MDLQSVLAALAKMSAIIVMSIGRRYGFTMDDALLAAVTKVQWRTPYMWQWGDRPQASSVAEAMEHWSTRKRAKNSEEAMAFTPNKGFGGQATCPADTLVLTVACLTDGRGCPWARTKTPEEMIGFIHEEVSETKEELAQLEGGDSTEKVRLALVSELGDILFSVLMAIFLSARDFRVDVEAIFQEALIRAQANDALWRSRDSSP